MRTWRAVTSQPPTFDHSAFLDAAAANGIDVTIGIALDGGNVFDNGDPSLGQDYLDFYTATAEKLAELYGDHRAVMGFCLGNEQNNPSRIVRTSFWDGLAGMAQAVRAKAPGKLVVFAMENDNPDMFTATPEWHEHQRAPALRADFRCLGNQYLCGDGGHVKQLRHVRGQRQ